MHDLGAGRLGPGPIAGEDLDVGAAGAIKAGQARLDLDTS
jgi:hypothetical protein